MKKPLLLVNEDMEVQDVLTLEGVGNVWELLCERLGWHPRVY